MATRAILISEKVDPIQEPDVLFMEEARAEPSRISLVIASAVIVPPLIWVMGRIVRFISATITPTETVSVDLLSKIIGGIAAVALYTFFDRRIHAFADGILVKLQIAERFAPYFGHRLERTIHILKG